MAIQLYSAIHYTAIQRYIVYMLYIIPLEGRTLGRPSPTHAPVPPTHRHSVRHPPRLGHCVPNMTRYRAVDAAQWRPRRATWGQEGAGRRPDPSRTIGITYTPPGTGSHTIHTHAYNLQDIVERLKRSDSSRPASLTYLHPPRAPCLCVQGGSVQTYMGLLPHFFC